MYFKLSDSITVVDINQDILDNLQFGTYDFAVAREILQSHRSEDHQFLNNILTSMPRQHNHRIETVHSDFLQMELHVESYDEIYALESIHYALDPINGPEYLQERIRFLQNLLKSLKRGGRLYIEERSARYIMRNLVPRSALDIGGTTPTFVVEGIRFSIALLESSAPLSPLETFLHGYSVKRLKNILFHKGYHIQLTSSDIMVIERL